MTHPARHREYLQHFRVTALQGDGAEPHAYSHAMHCFADSRCVTSCTVILPASAPVRSIHSSMYATRLPDVATFDSPSQDDLFKANFYLSLMEFRDLTLRRLRAFSARGFFSVADYLRDPLRFQAALEALSFCDYSLAIKAGVHYTLCGGACNALPVALCTVSRPSLLCKRCGMNRRDAVTVGSNLGDHILGSLYSAKCFRPLKPTYVGAGTIAKLGTEKHHQKYFEGLDTLATPGCFGMTELGHGSNVMGIETTVSPGQCPWAPPGCLWSQTCAEPTGCRKHDSAMVCLLQCCSVAYTARRILVPHKAHAPAGGVRRSLAAVHPEHAGRRGQQVLDRRRRPARQDLHRLRTAHGQWQMAGAARVRCAPA